jgi:hypothetical protein
MSSFIYGKHREKLLTAAFNWLTSDIRMAFVTSGYVPNQDVDEFLSVIDPAHILIRSGSLTGKTATSGYAAGLTPEFLLYRNENPVAGIVLFLHTGVDATARLLAYSNDGPALPFVGLGFNYAVSYNAAQGGFYRA